MVTLKDVRDDLRAAKLALERGQANPAIIAATYDKAIGDLQDIEAAITQVMVFDPSPRGLSARSEPKEKG